MRSYRRAALLAGFISVCEDGGDSRASLPSTLRAEARTFAEAIAAQSTGGDADDEQGARTRDRTWDGLLGGYGAAWLEANPSPYPNPNLNHPKP